MAFEMVSGVDRVMGVLDRVEIVEGEGMGSFGGKCAWASHCNQRGLCGVVIFFSDAWRRSSSQITLGFLVIGSGRFAYLCCSLGCSRKGCRPPGEANVRFGC